MTAWVQLWLNGTLRSNKEKDQEQDVAEFSFAVANLEDMGTYQCRYQVSEPLWTSELSDPVELMLAGAGGRSRGNLVVAVVRGCAAVFVFSLGLYFILDARSLWTRRDKSPGLTPETPKSVPFQVGAWGSGPQIPLHPLGHAENIAMETHTLPMGPTNDPQPPMAYSNIYVPYLCPAHGKSKSAMRGTLSPQTEAPRPTESLQTLIPLLNIQARTT
ncbi:uncharacterized protein LOC128074696 isoform X2 [Tympanuchus pallidicinctus]|nr:uncharacterized protein LOC128074696 isoform X2 [Tympanuchus pallidicinctus]